jgi:hypothetical protein
MAHDFGFPSDGGQSICPAIIDDRFANALRHALPGEKRLVPLGTPHKNRHYNFRSSESLYRGKEITDTNGVGERLYL